MLSVQQNKPLLTGNCTLTRKVFKYTSVRRWENARVSRREPSQSLSARSRPITRCLIPTHSRGKPGSWIGVPASPAVLASRPIRTKFWLALEPAAAPGFSLLLNCRSGSGHSKRSLFRASSPLISQSQTLWHLAWCFNHARRRVWIRRRAPTSVGSRLPEGGSRMQHCVQNTIGRIIVGPLKVSITFIAT